MTTATKDTTDAVATARTGLHDLRLEIQQTFDALPDWLDLPPMTDRQKGAERNRRHQLPQHTVLCNTLIEQLDTAVATRTTKTPQRDRLLAAQAAIEQEIKDAGDWREVVDNRERDRAWQRQTELAASLTAIQRGVEYFNGRPGLPMPLRELLTDVCAHCGHATLNWPGPLPGLEEEIAEADRVLALMPGNLASLRASVAPCLGEPVSS